MCINSLTLFQIESMQLALEHAHVAESDAYGMGILYMVQKQVKTGQVLTGKHGKSTRSWEANKPQGAGSGLSKREAQT